MDAYGGLNPVLEITVHGCSKLKNMNLFTKQHPYVWLDYVGMEFKTTTYKEGGNNPTYDQKYYFRLIEDVDQLDVHVYSKNSVAVDTFIGSGRVYLQRVLSLGYDETDWPIVDKHKKFAGEVKLSMTILQSEVRIAPSAPPLMNNEEPVEDVGLPMFTNALGNISLDKILEKIGLFLINKALEDLGPKVTNRIWKTNDKCVEEDHDSTAIDH